MINAVVKKIVVLSGRRDKGQRLLKIDCPFCGQEHTHGGGLVESDIQQWGGSRVCHCAKPEHTGQQYSLEIPRDVPYEYK